MQAGSHGQKVYEIKMNKRLLISLCLLWHCLIIAAPVGSQVLNSGFGHYSDRAVGIELPKSAEILLLKKTGAKKVVDLRLVVYERRAERDYLAVAVSLEVEKGFEALYHHSFVFEKKRNEEAWSNARLYRTMRNIVELFTLPASEFRKAIVELK